MTRALLPTSSTPWEQAAADGLSAVDVSEAAIAAIRTAKLVAPPQTFLPFLIHEYGLTQLTPYVPNLFDLIEEGIDWQRIRGTHAAVAKGLGWLNYTASIEEAKVARFFWNSFQLRFPALPAADAPDLERIEGIAGLSVPVRSRLRRGVHLYDAGPLEADGSRLDGSMLERESGVPFDGSSAIWSFGRLHEFEHTLTEAEGTAIGNWVPPYREISPVIDENDIVPGDYTLSFAEDDVSVVYTATLDTADDSQDTVALEFDVADGIRVRFSRSPSGLAEAAVESGGGTLAGVTGAAWPVAGQAAFGFSISTSGKARLAVSGATTIEIADITAAGPGGMLPEADAIDVSADRVAFFERGLTATELNAAVAGILAGDDPLAVLVEELEGLTWGEMTFPWSDANFPWAGGYLYQRRIGMAAWFEGETVFAAFVDDTDEVIGYRRIRSLHPVLPDGEGMIAYGGGAYAPSADGSQVYFEALSQFGDGAGNVAQIGLLIGAALSEGVKPGKLWLEPDEVSGGTIIAAKPVNSPLRPTVREQVKFMLRF